MPNRFEIVGSSILQPSETVVLNFDIMTRDGVV